MKVDDTAVVGRAEVRRVLFEDPIEDDLGRLLIAFVLTVHGGDAEVDLEVGVVRVPFRKR